MLAVTMLPDAETKTMLDYVRESLETEALPKTGCGLSKCRWDALEKAERLGLPHRKLEQWRFTELKTLLSTGWQAYPKNDEAALELGCAQLIKQAQLFDDASKPLRLVFVNGQFSPVLSNWKPGETLPEGLEIALLSEAETLPSEAQQRLQHQLKGVLEATESGLDAAFQALASEGLYIRLKENALCSRPLEITLFNEKAEQPRLAPLRLLVDMAKNSEATLGLQQLNQAGQATVLAPLLSSIQLGANASLKQSQAWQPSEAALSYSDAAINLTGEAAKYQLVQLATGGAWHRHNAVVTIAGERADAQLYGLQVLNGKTELHQHVKLDHQVPEATSTQRFKSLVDDEAKSEFEGRIFVRPDAQQTDAQQLSKALLLSPKAKAFTRPWLNIDADDVSCSHGATVGQLSKDELFYLASRGLPESVARCLLTYGFAADILTQESDPVVRQALIDRTLDSLGLTQNPAFCFTNCAK